MKRFFTRNIGLKLLAFAISVFLWLVVSGGRQGVRVYPVPIEYSVPADRVLTGDVPTTLSLSVRATEADLAGVDPSRLGAPVELGSFPLGGTRVVLDPVRNVRGLPPGVAVETIAPQILELRTERKLRRALNVIARVEGSPSPGCVLRRIEVVPSRMLVEGAESLLADMKTLSTEPIDLTGRCQTTILSVDTQAHEGLLFVSPRPVTVTLRIERAPGAAP